MVESHWVKPAPIPLINRSVGWFSPILPPRPFKYRFVFKGLLQKRNPVGEHLIDISRRDVLRLLYFGQLSIIQGWLYLKLLALLLIVFLPFPFFGYLFHRPSAFPLK